MSDDRDITGWVLPDQMFHDGHLRADRALGLADDKVATIIAANDLPPGAPVTRIAGILSPGFVDLQVNGGGGVLLNTTPTPEGMRAIAKAHRAFGTTAIMPTVITDTPDVMTQAVDAAIATRGEPGLLGLHIEGPHIALNRRGTHKAEFVRPMVDATMGQLQRLRAAGVPTLLTLAPEVVPPATIRQLVDLGVIVSLGHTEAAAEVVQAALAAGASCFTHLFNAMPPMAGRNPGPVGAAINSTAYAGIICDGVHVADDMVRLACRARPVLDRMFIVSDAMPTVGGPPAFDLYGSPVRLEENRLVNSEGALAGAHTTQAAGVARLVNHVGLSVEEALRMAITNAGSVLGVDCDKLDGRRTSDVITLGPDLNLTGDLASRFA